jgi:hypothetical protein
VELSGSVSDNLRAAITSARRFRGHPVHRDTLKFWQDLLAYAQTYSRRASSAEPDMPSLIAQLQEELDARRQG